MKLLAVDSNNQQSKSLKDYNKYVTKVRLVSFIFAKVYNYFNKIIYGKCF